MNSISARDVGLRGGLLAPQVPVVFVVDDDISVRESLELLIEGAGWRSQVFDCAENFLASTRTRTPSCLVLDMALPHLNGLDVQECLAADGVDMPVIFISACGDVPTTVRAMKAGAIEFLTKPLREEALLAAIRNAIERSRTSLAQNAEMQGLLARYARLTPREREVMHLVTSGQLNKQAAGHLGISEITVKAHRGRMMRKMRARTLPDLVNMGAKLGPMSSRPAAHLGSAVTAVVREL